MDQIRLGLKSNIVEAEVNPLALVKPNSVRSWSIELTSRCNLRCTYCSVPHWPAYGAADMTVDQVSKILSLLKEGSINQLSVSGRGELTYLEGWMEFVQFFLNFGIPLHTVTNLAKPLTWEEAELLARFNYLAISIDSADQEQMKRVRKGADLRNIIYNVEMINAAAISQGRDKMPFTIISVLNKSNAFKIRELAALVVSLGATSLSLQDLVMDYSQDVDTVDVSHISHLSADELREFAR